ncbi:hypothetical protein ACFOSC_27840 [Streptantibioticus rubrisoli]|uniref:Uncharacterized protein n=1 Tax=Streptantibioticus rubrisoli TaxID=1387313 RepID=A0ABT1PKE0_9ACTN|nr:hypothetical protein [Streptantibioticus rubrisoli]MCQ4045836.1 hypothetical protein [Streptantibioticus rubrisoli]
MSMPSHLNQLRPHLDRPRFCDPRLDRVFRGLAPAEEAVALVWADGGTSWEGAALDTGLPAAYGERVRRKLKRLGERCTARTVAAAVTAGRDW